MNEFEEKSISKDDPEFPLWSVKSKATEAEVKVAEKLLLAYDRSEAEITAKVDQNKAEGREWHTGLRNQGSIAKDYFMESLTRSEASMPFVRMLMLFGPVLHWNDVADVCFWTLGFPTKDGLNQWDQWKAWKSWKGL